MKKIFTTLFVAIILAIASLAVAAPDMMMEKEIQQIVFKKDKNGNDFARIIVKDQRELNGVKYDREVAVMAFGDKAQAVRAYRKGQTIKAVVSVGEYRGNPSYTILHVVK